MTENGIHYTLHGDYYFPDISASDSHTDIGHYGRMRKAYLEEHRPGLYTRLILSGMLYEHLAEIDACCSNRKDRMIQQIADAEGINEELKARGIRLANIYTEPLCESAVIGEGNVIINSNGLGPNVVLGNGNVLNGYVITGHDVKMGDFNFLGPRCMLLGYVSIGNSNTIGAGSIILAHKSIGNNNTIAPLSVVYRSCQDSMHLLGNPAKRVEF